MTNHDIHYAASLQHDVEAAKYRKLADAAGRSADVASYDKWMAHVYKHEALAVKFYGMAAGIFA